MRLSSDHNRHLKTTGSYLHHRVYLTVESAARLSGHMDPSQEIEREGEKMPTELNNKSIKELSRSSSKTAFVLRESFTPRAR